MIREMKEYRFKQKSGNYLIRLEVPEDSFMSQYHSISKDSAKKFITDYLIYRDDFGKPGEINIYHNKEGHKVKVSTNLDYLSFDRYKQ